LVPAGTEALWTKTVPLSNCEVQVSDFDVDFLM
jgi:hypothetical protein